MSFLKQSQKELTDIKTTTTLSRGQQPFANLCADLNYKHDQCTNLVHQNTIKLIFNF